MWSLATAGSSVQPSATWPVPIPIHPVSSYQGTHQCAKMSKGIKGVQGRFWYMWSVYMPLTSFTLCTGTQLNWTAVFFFPGKSYRFRMALETFRNKLFVQCPRKCNPDVTMGPSTPSNQHLSIEDLQDMISSLEERQVLSPGTWTNSVSIHCSEKGSVCWASHSQRSVEFQEFSFSHLIGLTPIKIDWHQGRRQLAQAHRHNRNTTSPAQRRLGTEHSHGEHSHGEHSEMEESETEELTPKKQATCSFDIIGWEYHRWHFIAVAWRYPVSKCSSYQLLEFQSDWKSHPSMECVACPLPQVSCWHWPELELCCILFRIPATRVKLLPFRAVDAVMMSFTSFVLTGTL